MKTFKRILFWVTFIGIIIALQFIPVSHGNPPVSEIIPLNEEAEIALKSACWDCHSNETRYPWYSKVSPISLLIQYHINGGRQHLNFTEWDTYSFEEQKKLLHKISYILNKKEMPPFSYTLLHQEAVLNHIELESIYNWTNQVIEYIESVNDSTKHSKY